MSGPLVAILDSFTSGARSLDEICRITGMPADIVRAGIDHLVRTGRLQAKSLTAGCPSGGCGSCASGTLDGAPGCGAATPSPARSGPVLVQLTMPTAGRVLDLST